MVSWLAEREGVELRTQEEDVVCFDSKEGRDSKAVVVFFVDAAANEDDDDDEVEVDEDNVDIATFSLMVVSWIDVIFLAPPVPLLGNIFCNEGATPILS